MTAMLYTWDWNGQPPMTEIAGYVASLTAHQRPVYLTPVTETGDDSYGLVASDVELTPEQARQLYMTPHAVVQVEVALGGPRSSLGVPRASS